MIYSDYNRRQIRTNTNDDIEHNNQTNNQAIIYQTPVAVFDLDGTMLKMHTPVLFIFYALKRHLIAFSSIPHIIKWSLAYLLSLHRRPEDVRELMFAGFIGKTPDEASPFFDEFIDLYVLKRLSTHAADEVKQQQTLGRDTVLLTGSFTQIAERVANEIGFDAFCGTDMTIDKNGIYDGTVDGIVPEGYGKLYRLAELCDKRYGKGHWRIAAAYGDHLSDRWLLERADEPVCVNGWELRRYGKRNGWREERW